MSISRRLGERYIHHWLAAHPGGTVAERDLMKPAIPYMNVDWIAGVYPPTGCVTDAGDAGGVGVVRDADR
jgi:FMN-dependent NADH-azoreductase